MTPWTVYILSNNAHTLYIGATPDPWRRKSEHQLKTRPDAFTARYTFDRVVYYEVLPDEASALRREKQLKGWTRAKKVAPIQSVNPYWNDILPAWQDVVRMK
ncbi:MAG TPA: GIY-YIG nuclease family protein [Thermoanaerobaculia bacterium]